MSPTMLNSKLPPGPSTGHDHRDLLRHYDERELAVYRPRVVHLDAENEIVDAENEIAVIDDRVSALPA